eukprot:3941367-Rhodomonas_salina.2
MRCAVLSELKVLRAWYWMCGTEKRVWCYQRVGRGTSCGTRPLSCYAIGYSMLDYPATDLLWEFRYGDGLWC